MFFSQFEVALSGAIATLLFPARVFIDRLSSALSLNSSKRRFERLTKAAASGSKHEGSIRGKVCVVTGSNTGIGKSTALQLALLGAGVVVLACRDVSRGEEAKAELIKLLLASRGETSSSADTPSCIIDFIPLDLSSLHSIKAFSEELSNKYQRLDILVNNAGLNAAGITKDNLQQLFQVNYLGHYLLLRLLVPLLCKPRVIDDGENVGDNDVGRVVNLSSVMHHTGQCDFIKSAYSKYTDADCKRGFSYYSDSKLYMNFLTMEINRRYSHADEIFSDESVTKSSNNSSINSSGSGKRQRRVIAISVNPGAVRSDIWRNIKIGVVRWVFDLVSRIFFLDTEDGAKTSVFACIVPMSETKVGGNLETYKHGSGDLCSRESEKKEGEAHEERRRDEEKTDRQWCEHPNLPYFSPYYVPKYAIIGRLGFELAGPFEYPTETEVSLPANPTTKAIELWEFSSELCGKILGSVSW